MFVCLIWFQCISMLWLFPVVSAASLQLVCIQREQEWRSHREVRDSFALAQRTLAFTHTYTTTQTHLHAHTLDLHLPTPHTALHSGLFGGIRQSCDAGKHLDEADQIKNTPEKDHKVPECQTNGHLRYSFSNRHWEQWIPDTLLPYNNSFSKLWQEEWCYIRQQQGGLHAACCSIVSIIDYKCCTAFCAPASETLSLSFPWKLRWKFNGSLLPITDSRSAWPAPGKDVVSASSHWQYWSSRTPSRWVNTG